MLDPKNINEIVQNIMEQLPPGLKQLPEDIKQTLRRTITNTFDQFDLVTREEFDAQCRVLLRTREKLEALEKKIAELK